MAESDLGNRIAELEGAIHFVAFEIVVARDGLRTSQKPKGSKFFEPVSPMNMGSGPSPPTYPLQNSFRLVEERATGAGANAQAEATSDARITDFMVYKELPKWSQGKKTPTRRGMLDACSQAPARDLCLQQNEATFSNGHSLALSGISTNDRIQSMLVGHC